MRHETQDYGIAVALFLSGEGETTLGRHRMFDLEDVPTIIFYESPAWRRSPYFRFKEALKLSRSVHKDVSIGICVHKDNEKFLKPLRSFIWILSLFVGKDRILVIWNLAGKSGKELEIFESWMRRRVGLRDDQFVQYESSGAGLGKLLELRHLDPPRKKTGRLSVAWRAVSSILF